ncbi:hypothetical protein Tco_1000366 [Tanacetum coccineum]
MEHSGLNNDTSFTSNPSYFFHDQHEIHQREDHKNILGSSYKYNFDTNTYQAGPFINEHQYASRELVPHASGSTLYWSNKGHKLEKDNVVGQCKVERYNPIPSVSHDTRVSNDMTTTGTSSSTSILPKHGLRMKDFDPDDDIGPSTFSELDTLLEY